MSRIACVIAYAAHVVSESLRLDVVSMYGSSKQHVVQEKKNFFDGFDSFATSFSLCFASEVEGTIL